MDIQVHVQIMDGDDKQESAVNFALLMASAQVYSLGNPDVKYAWCKSDQAGTYKSESLLVPLWSARNQFGSMKLKGWKYSSPGDGKDRYAKFVLCFSNEIGFLHMKNRLYQVETHFSGVTALQPYASMKSKE